MLPDPTETGMRIESFKRELSEAGPLDVVRKLSIHGSCAAMPDDSYYELRRRVSIQFGVHPNEVLVVGSGKLGFSIAPEKRYREFCSESDIDLVVLSESLFNQFWWLVHEYWLEYGLWDGFSGFRKYLFRGWIRPDMLPPSGSFDIALQWWQFFNALTAKDGLSMHKISGALYKDWRFLESYQISGVRACAQAVQSEVITHAD
jgi:hypothetical protein